MGSIPGTRSLRSGKPPGAQMHCLKNMLNKPPSFISPVLFLHPVTPLTFQVNVSAFRVDELFGNGDTWHAHARQVSDGHLEQEVQHLKGIPVPSGEGAFCAHGVVLPVRVNG